MLISRVLLAFCFLSLLPIVAHASEPVVITSPDKLIEVTFGLTDEGAPTYSVTRGGKSVLLEAPLGLVTEHADLSAGLTQVSVSDPFRVRETYEIRTAKRRHNVYIANRVTVELRSDSGYTLSITFQVSDDGFVFRYGLPEGGMPLGTIRSEATGYRFVKSARAWVQPMSVAKTGWEQSNPSYEEFYEMDIPVGTPSPLGAGWVYPALFRTGDNWVLISESSLERGNCGTRLIADEVESGYHVGMPDPREVRGDGPLTASPEAGWTSPWRVVVIGSLKTVTESMLGVDVAKPSVVPLAPWMEPGASSWSWVLLKDNNTIEPVQERFINYAADMGWEYCLVDCTWDTRIGDEGMRRLARLAKAKGVKLIAWYNSAGDWNTTPYTPRDRLLTKEDRAHEFKRLKDIGIAGMKVDFFGGDGSSMIEHYIDIMGEALDAELLLNFHGATLPRGWQRTYPNLMTVEAIKGLEFITFGQPDADREPEHAAMLPFTRNVFDPMDFTPMVLDSIPNIERRTTSAFELALSILFTSGIQHYGEKPEGMSKAPDYVRDFLRELPGVWENSVFLVGFPGECVAMARKGRERWYAAGINSTDEPMTMNLDLTDLGTAPRGVIITDGEGGNLSFRLESFNLSEGEPLDITVKPHGGFVVRFEP